MLCVGICRAVQSNWITFLSWRGEKTQSLIRKGRALWREACDWDSVLCVALPSGQHGPYLLLRTDLQLPTSPLTHSDEPVTSSLGDQGCSLLLLPPPSPPTGPGARSVPEGSPVGCEPACVPLPQVVGTSDSCRSHLSRARHVWPSP